MSPEKQRIAIAEACGFRPEWNSRWVKDGVTYFYPPVFCESTLPDYLNDLNAMHEAILTLGEKDVEFGAALIKVLGLEHKQDFDVWRHATVAAIAKADAAQLVEAFLRAIGKWEE